MVLIEKNLRKQYGPHGIYAGATHFRDYWARDSLFACLGALAIGDHEQVRKTLEHFLANLRADGHVPLRIGARSEVARYFGLPTRTGAIHAQDKGSNDSVDGNALLLIVAAEYERKTNKKLDRALLTKTYGWLIKRERNGLLSQGPYACWEDSIKVSGPRLYTNVCTFAAHNAAAYLFQDLKANKRAALSRSQIQKWWCDDHFTDGESRDAAIVMTAGNLLAVVWGVANKEQSKKILVRIANRTSVCPPGGFFRPTMREVFIPFFFIGLADYHAKIEWSWLAPLEMLAYRTVGNTKELNARKKAFDTLVTTFGGVFEVYERNAPVKRWFYRSETNFAWALGVYCLARRMQNS